MFETGVVRANKCSSWRQARRHNRDILSILFNMKIYCVFSLESPHYKAILMRTSNIPFPNMKKEIILNYPKSADMGFVPRDPRTSSKQPR